MGREEDASHASLHNQFPIPELKEGVECTPSYALYRSTVHNQVACFIHSHSQHIRLSLHQTCNQGVSYNKV
jgi:hypothetical protein